MDLASASLRQLQYLDAVASGLSFSEAAEHLQVSQSALSQGLARLEELAGSPLFEPDGRRRRLTRQGTTLAGYAARVLSETREASDTLRAQAGGVAGAVRVAMIDAAALYLFSNEIESFRDTHPAVDFTIRVATSDGCLSMLDRFEVDVAIVVGPAGRRPTVPLLVEPLYLFGSSGEPAPDDRWMLYPSGSHTRAHIDRALAERALSPTVAGESGNPEVLRQLAVLVGGWTVLPDVVGSIDRVGWGRRARIAERPIVAAHRSARLDPLSERLLDQLAGAEEPQRFLQ